MNWKEHKKQPMKDPEFKKKYEALDAEVEIKLQPRHQSTFGRLIAQSKIV